MDKQKHKLYMAQILSLIFKDKDCLRETCSMYGSSWSIYMPTSTRR